MKETKPTGKTLFGPYKLVSAWVSHILGKWRLGKQVSDQNVPACECCQTNLARVRVDRLYNGRIEPHFLCQSCAEYTTESRGF